MSDNPAKVEKTEQKPRKTRRSGQIIERKKSAVYLIRVFDKRDATGKRRYYNKTFHGTKPQAQKWLNEALVRLDRGEAWEAAPVSVNEYLDRWLADAAKPRLRERVAADYADRLRLHVRPYIGKQRLADVNALDIQAIYTKLAERGLSARSIRYTHAVLASAFKQAVKWGLLERDVTRLVELPKQQRREMQVLTREQAFAFLQETANDRYAVLFALALETGMRPEEYLALQWKDLNWQGGELSIQRVFIESRNGNGWHYEEPKTAKSRRPIPLSASLLARLRMHKTRQLEERLKLGALWQDYDLVFTSEIGTHVSLNNLRKRHFKPALKRAGLPESLRVYDLRHTTASLLLATNVHAKVVSERLGHSSIILTLDTYSHILPGIQQNATAQLEQLLFANVGTL
jgi:integrase